MGYTTKEFCRLCNVGRETLRHYERLGFLRPKVNPDNNYRSYDEWDASIVADIKRYQAVGLSLDEIKKLLTKHDLEQLASIVENRVQFYREQADYFRMLRRKSEHELSIIHQLPQLLNQYDLTEITSLLYLSGDELKDGISSESDNSAMRHLDLFTPCLRIDQHFTGDESQQDYSGWGLITEKEYADYYHIWNGTIIPASTAICTIIDAGEKGNITQSLFDGFINHIRESTNEKAPVVYAYLLARTHDKFGKYHRYLYTICPILD